MKHVLDHIHEASLSATAKGTVADYIPALAKADPSLLGIAVVTAEGEIFSTGAADTRSTMQSISKVLVLAYVMTECGEEAVFSRVGQEPSGDPFNSMICLETSAARKPFNPFINAGAIVVPGLMPGDSPEDKGARNRSIAWFLKELGILSGEVEETLDDYFRQCAVSVDALDLARIGAILCTEGVDPSSGSQLLAARTTSVIKSLMVTCGLYDGSGEFAVEVGVPAKSGVGSGIMASVRDRMGIGVYGPALDQHGNSSAGIEALRRLSDELDLRVL